MHSVKIKLNGLDVRYYTGGSGDPLIIVHGGGAGGASWLKAASKLAGHYTVYLPDLPGYGDSKPHSNNFHIVDYVRFLSNFSDSLGIERYYLIGHSIGGAIALEIAMEHPERVRKMVLVDSLGLSSRVGLWVRMLTSSVLMHSLGKIVPLGRRFAGWFVRTLLISVKLADPMPSVRMDLGRYIVNLKQKSGLSDRLTNLKVSTLLVWGAGDTIVPVSNAVKAAQLIPDCRLSIFEGCRHFVYRQNTEKFCQAVINFLIANNRPCRTL